MQSTVSCMGAPLLTLGGLDYFKTGMNPSVVSTSPCGPAIQTMP